MKLKHLIPFFLLSLFSATITAQDCETNEIAALLSTGSWAYEVNFTISNSEGEVVFELADATDSTLYDNTDYEFSICLEDGCYTLEMFDAFGDGWNDASLLLFNNGSFQTFALESGSYAAAALAVNSEDCQLTIPGCTDVDALNYNPGATIDDGSCEYPFTCDGGIEVQLYICVFSQGESVALEILDSDSTSIFNVSGLNDGQVAYFDLCLDPNECYTALMSNAGNETGWYGGYFWVNIDGNMIINESLDDNLSSEQVAFSINSENCPVFGCTDPEALNYDAEASDDDSSCIYPLACDNNTISATLFNGNWPEEMSWNIEDENGNAVLSGAGDNDAPSMLVEGCADDGCYTLNLFDSFGDGWNGGFIMIYVNGEFVLEITIENGSFEQTAFGINTEGCEPEIISGCTDPQAENYNPEAEEDDGSCVYPEVENDLCADATPLEEGTILISNVGAYDNENIYGDCWNSGGGEGEQTSIWFSFTTPEDTASIHIEASADGSWTLTDTQFGIFEECGGEMIYCDGNGGDGLYSALNFECGELAPATTYLLVVDGWFGDEGTCFLTYEVDVCEPLAGCTDPTALNYDSAATIDDGSCEYLEDCTDNIVEIITDTQIWANEISWVIMDADSNVVTTGEGFNDNDSVFDILCLPDGCYSLELYDSFGDGWNGATINIAANGTDIVFTTLEQGFFTTVSFGIGDVDCGEPQDDIFGCTDPQALNYNPEATINDGSCDYDDECEFNTVSFITATEAWGEEVNWLLYDADGNILYQGGNYVSNSVVTENICLPDGCYTLELYDSFGDGWNGGVITVLSNNETLVFTTLEDGSFDSVNFGVNADCGDNPIDIFGCTDPAALNYTPEATINDGSCEYDFECQDNIMLLHFDIGEVADSTYLQYGIGQEYNAYIVTGTAGTGVQQYTVDVCIPDGCYSIFLDSWNDASWVGSSVTATLDGDTLFSLAPQEDLDVIELSFGVNDDCQEEIFGCTDPEANNYNPEATADDDSCEYPIDCDANVVTVNLSTESWGQEVVWTIVDENLNAVASGNGYESNNDYSIDLCLEDGCYGFIMLDLFGDGWNGAEVNLMLDSLVIGEGGLPNGSEGSFVFGVNSDCSGNDGLIAGCTDEDAMNFDPNATLENGGCVYSFWEEPMAALTADETVDFAAMLLPNPGIGPVNLKIDALNPEEATLVEIHDMTGRLVFSANYGRDQANLNEVIDISEFAAGMHLVTITNGTQREVIRLIKQH